MTDKTIRIEVRGRVQGVGFRYALYHVAVGHQLRGWCRNRPDGVVEAVLSGPAAQVHAVLAWCRQGPPLARVDELLIAAAAEVGLPDGFEIRH